MTSKFRLFALGAMLGFGAVSFSGAGASAGALPLSPLTSGQVNTVSDGIIQVSHNKGPSHALQVGVATGRSPLFPP